MKRFPLLGSLAIVLCGLTAAPFCGASGTGLHLPGEHDPEFLLLGEQGYLGVDLGEVESDRVTTLHLKDTHGAEVTMIDHDAPAGKSGLRVHDVILQLDAQPFDTADQLRRRLHEMPPGRTVTFLVSRDGNLRTLSVQLCDRSKLQQQAWLQHISLPAPAVPKAHGESFLGKAPSAGPAFLASVLPKTLYVGADVNPVRTQLADYFGVKSGTGLLVENVDDQSPAAHAGMKAGDVIVRVDAQPMKSRGDWLKAMRKHRGRPVQVTVMRNKQEQTLTMSAGKPKKS